jgi:rubrerythrin
MGVFEASDIVEVAVRIEENGANFYRFAGQIASHEEAKALFAHLAEAEVAHQRVFEGIFAQMEHADPPESYQGEYQAYLRNYVDNKIIFTKDVMDRELAAVKDTPSALDFAMQRELDSILYYHEIKNLLPAGQHPAVERIIAEERKHYSGLAEMKKRFLA